MTRKIVGWLVLVPLCLVLIVFALANRHLVAVNLNPFNFVEAPAPGYGVPLFIVLYVVLLVGVLLGGIATWFAQAHHRRAEKHWRREARHLNEELETMRRNQVVPANAPVAEVDDLLELR
ncbi:lipopolysaccharide assembly protein LapA domain-containing protein [Devosia sp. RR2S18]|jgi:uncharacterized integral membrane protein|uniref:lipopolysaccharide assembly protein LapA domain-containing protein n=1 Tax=Devosia rhizosphaerae TaxID=3049774 RepID=UPI00253FFF99|nr:lipopolysaccharide assembly protein LapA domain-containing protein [Devosia sp. RR2S18]WIJ25301.1 lipopolysaccharide assembly protein LapA domain-containing protein [Devosia sp. RR2S18]